jgi:hypothetical protein
MPEFFNTNHLEFEFYSSLAILHPLLAYCFGIRIEERTGHSTPIPTLPEGG